MILRNETSSAISRISLISQQLIEKLINTTSYPLHFLADRQILKSLVPIDRSRMV